SGAAVRGRGALVSRRRSVLSRCCRAAFVAHALSPLPLRPRDEGAGERGGGGDLPRRMLLRRLGVLGGVASSPCRDLVVPAGDARLTSPFCFPLLSRLSADYVRGIGAGMSLHLLHRPVGSTKIPRREK